MKLQYCSFGSRWPNGTATALVDWCQSHHTPDASSQNKAIVDIYDCTPMFLALTSGSTDSSQICAYKQSTQRVHSIRDN